MKFRSKQFWVAVLVLCAVVCLIAALALLLPRGGQPVQPAPTPSPTAVPLPEPVPEGTPEPEPTASAIPEEVDGLPVGKWVITAERKAYVEDSLTLYLPAIQITRAVHDGTDAATLNRGVGLYEYAQVLALVGEPLGAGAPGGGDEPVAGELSTSAEGQAVALIGGMDGLYGGMEPELDALLQVLIDILEDDQILFGPQMLDLGL